METERVLSVLHPLERAVLPALRGCKELKEIAEKKMPDLNANGIEEAMKTIEGTAKNMGISIE